ncbi:MAG: twin-arginine translocase subunit TatC [Microbacterium sp.]
MAAPDIGVTPDERESRRDRRMTLAAHLKELRKRLVIALIALVVGMIVSFILTDYIIDFLIQPVELVRDRLDDEFSRLTYTSIADAFNMRMRIAFAVGLVVSAPVWLWQIWAFIMPGLKRREIVYSFAFMAAAIPLFFGGCVVALLVMPNVIVMMSQFVPQEEFASQIYEANSYYDFVLKLVVIVGVAFVLPVFLVALNLAGVLRGKTIIRSWRGSLIVCLVFGMLASPPADVVTMLILAGILYVLYLAAAVVALLFDRRKRRKNPDLFVEL